MKKTLLAGVAVLVVAGSTAVYAQHRGFDGPWDHHRARIHPEDRAAFADARIAAVKAGLRLTPEQEKLWPPLETAVRDFARLRIERANARMQARGDEDRGFDGRRFGREDSRREDLREPDPVARLRDRADRMGETAAALKRIAETADPLYKTLDDGQKRRLSVLTHMEGRSGHGGWRHHGYHRGMDRDDSGRDRGFERDRYDRDGGQPKDRGDRGGPERL